MSKQKYKTHFQDIWLENPSFKGWVLKHPTDNYMTCCNVCSKDISTAAHRIKAIVGHSDRSKHFERMPNRVSQPSLFHVHLITLKQLKQCRLNHHKLNPSPETKHKQQLFPLLASILFCKLKLCGA